MLQTNEVVLNKISKVITEIMWHLAKVNVERVEGLISVHNSWNVTGAMACYVIKTLE